MIDFSLFTLGCAILLQFFFFNDTATTEIYTLSLHDALPIFPAPAQSRIVYVNSYGGVWETSWRKAFFEPFRSEEHTSELQSHLNLVCRLLLEKKNRRICRHLLAPAGSKYITVARRRRGNRSS